MVLKQKARRSFPPLNTQCLEKISEKWGTECLKTRFPLPTLLCAGYSVKLKNVYLHEILKNSLKVFYAKINDSSKVRSNEAVGGA